MWLTQSSEWALYSARHCQSLCSSGGSLSGFLLHTVGDACLESIKLCKGKKNPDKPQLLETNESEHRKFENLAKRAGLKSIFKKWLHLFGVCLLCPTNISSLKIVSWWSYKTKKSWKSSDWRSFKKKTADVYALKNDLTDKLVTKIVSEHHSVITPDMTSPFLCFLDPHRGRPPAHSSVWTSVHCLFCQ